MGVNSFDVMKRMGERSGKIQLAPLSNITNLQKVKAGTKITIGVEGDVVADIGLHGKFVGGLILADKEEFRATEREMQSVSQIKTRVEIEAEIKALEPIAKDYDTERQSNDTCLAAGAHDALRWLLGLAEDSISESLKAK